MSLSRGEVNPLSVLGLRRLSFIPQHFAKIVTRTTDIKMLDHWINYNLNSRYAIKLTLTLNSNNKFTEICEIGLEDPKEIIMLTLGCPFLTKKENNYG
jgi:hypothetical protein